MWRSDVLMCGCFEILGYPEIAANLYIYIYGYSVLTFKSGSGWVGITFMLCGSEYMARKKDDSLCL